MPGIHYDITADNSNFMNRVNATRDAIRTTVADVERSGQSLDGIFGRLESGLKRIALASAGAFTVSKALDFGRQCVEVRANIQALETSFETLLKSKEKADVMLSDIKKFAATTPMDMDVLAKGAQTMLGFNMEAEKVLPMLHAIGDISMGDAAKFESLSLAFSQMSATGRLMGQDLLQMINAGFNPLAQISEKTGKSIAALKEEMEKGGISVEMVTQAFIDATSEGGKFHGMLHKQAEGLNGAFAYLRGSISGMMNDIGQSVEGPVTKAVNMAGDLVKNYREVAETIAVLIAMYGTYKAAVVTTAALELSHIGRLRKLVAAKHALIAAQARLNAVMSANPYGLVLAAVIALAYGVYKLSTAQSDYEKSLKSADEAVRKQESSMREEQSTLDGLRKKLEGAKKGSDEWKSTKDQIISQFGKYHSGLDAEIEKTGTLASSYNRLTKSIRLSAAARAMDDYRKENDPSEEVDKTLENVRRSLTERKKIKVDNAGNIVKRKDGGFEYVDAIAGPLLESIMQKTYEYLQDGDLGRFNAKELAYLTQTGQLSKSGIRSSMQKTRDRIEANKAGEQRIAQRYGTSIAEIDGMEVGENVKVSANLKTVYDTAAKNYKDAQKKVEEMKKNRSAYTEAQWEEAQKTLKTSKEAFEKAGGEAGGETKTKKSGGPTAAQLESKEENAAGKLADILRKQGQERLRIEQDYEYKRWQSRINLMKEGEAKILEQQRLDFDKEKTELGRRLENELEAELNRQMAVFNAEQDALAAGNRKYAKKTFRDSDIDESAMKAIRDRYAALQEDLAKAQRKAEADRLQAAKESFNAYLKEFGSYQQKREAIEADYDKRIAEAATAGERMMLEAQKRKADSDLEYQQWIDSGEISLAFGDITNLSQQTISRLIEDMERYREKVVATFDPEKIEKYNEALNKLRMAEVENTFSAFGSMVPEYFTRRLAILKQINDEARIGLELTRRQEELNLRTQVKKGAIKIQAKTAGYNLSDADLADPGKIQEMSARMSSAAAGGDNLSSSLHDALMELLELNGEAAELGNATQKWNGNFSHLKEILAGLDGEDKFKAIAESVASAADMIGSLAGQVAQMADALGAEGLGAALGYLGDAMGSISNIASAFAKGDIIGGIAAAAGGVMNWVTKLAMAGDARHQKNIEALQKRIDALDRSYDKLGKSIAKTYSYDASALIGQQETLLRQQKALVAQQMQEEMSKKKSDDDKVRQYREQMEDLDEAIADAKESAMDAIFGDDLKSQIEDFASAYSEAWSSGESRALSARDTVRKMMRQMVEESIKAAIQGSGAMERIRQTLADFYSDNILTAGEQDYIYGLADELQKELDARFGQQADLLSDTYSQNPTAKGWDTFTQDQADVLTGRFTAFCETSEAIRGINAGIAESVKSSLLLASAQRDLMQDALNIHIVNMGHLEAISKNTRELATIREDLGKIERYVRNL